MQLQLSSLNCGYRYLQQSGLRVKTACHTPGINRADATKYPRFNQYTGKIPNAEGTSVSVREFPQPDCTFVEVTECGMWYNFLLLCRFSYN